MSKYHFDCTKFRGYKPCAPKKICAHCDEYSPWQRKILIIKLGALGDVLRTTPVLFALSRKYPQCHITWVTKRNARELLESSPRIHRIIHVDDVDSGGVLRLMAEHFDELHCYDKEDAAIALASIIKAKNKFGFYMNEFGQMAPLNKGSEFCFDLGLSDDLKFFKNKKTYQELTYDCSELPTLESMDPYDFTLSVHDRKKASLLFEELNWHKSKNNSPIIAFNTGSGRVFRTKQWIEEYYIELARLLGTQIGARILLLGGKDEDERNQRLAAQLQDRAYYPGCDFTICQFAAILEGCNATVTGDTLGMHLSIAVKTPVVVLFGSTCEQEVDLYGLGRKLIQLPPCGPCYKNECDQPDSMKCMRDIQPRMVSEATREVLQTSPSSA